jgi:hypothetical protein
MREGFPGRMRGHTTHTFQDGGKASAMHSFPVWPALSAQAAEERSRGKDKFVLSVAYRCIRAASIWVAGVPGFTPLHGDQTSSTGGCRGSCRAHAAMLHDQHSCKGFFGASAKACRAA